MTQKIHLNGKIKIVKTKNIMATCINKNSPEFKKLLEKTNESSIILSAKISLWQERTENYDRFPTMEELAEIIIDENKLTEIKQQAFQTFNSKIKTELLDFLTKLNFDVEVNDTVLNKKKINNLPLYAATDLIHKYIVVRNNINNKEFARQAAYVIFELLGKKSVIRKELINNIDKWEKYDELYEKHLKTYEKFANKLINDEEDSDEIPSEKNFSLSSWLAHREVILELITDMLITGIDKQYIGEKRKNEDFTMEYLKGKNFKNPYEKNIFLRLINKLWNFINKYILNVKLIDELTETQLKNRVHDIVDDVYKKDFTKFIRVYDKNEEGKIVDLNSGKELELKNFEETMNRDPYIKKTIQELSESPFIKFKLGGSAVIRNFGTLYRSKDEDFHDIDGVIDYNTMRKESNFFAFRTWMYTEGLRLLQENQKQFRQEVLKFISEQAWYKNLKMLHPEFKVTNIFTDRTQLRLFSSLVFAGTIEHPTEMIFNEETGKMEKRKHHFDFFVSLGEPVIKDPVETKYHFWSSIMKAKLSMGRAKDINDLIFFKPFEPTSDIFNIPGSRYFRVLYDKKELSNQRKASDNQFIDDKKEAYLEEEKDINGNDLDNPFIC